MLAKSLTILLIFLTLTYDSCLAQLRSLTNHERLQYKEKVRSMFYHAYDNYLRYAQDYDELMPISCSGMNTWGTFSLSLIDALDTLVIMGNHSEFRRVAEHLIKTVKFDTNTNVSVFETNIRVIGGLISAHLLAKRAGLPVDEGWPCSGTLLSLAEDVALRLLPAFDTATGMPYGTVNFLNGVPENETPITCTAGVGTFIVEFGALSRLTGNPVFEERALIALDSLQKYRSKIGLLGNHINVQNGKWVATDAGIGAGVDSYYEYLVKGGMMLQIPALIDVYNYDYELIKNYLKKNDWYVWVNMSSGSATMPIFQSLEAFFPGLLTLIGEIDQAKKSLYNYHQVWKQYGFVPEFYDIPQAKHYKREGYPLRPEFIESVLYLYQATKDPHLLMIGADVVDSIYHSARTDCGYATIKKVSDHTIEDRMESFFLAETLKYLYLLFDTDNFMHNKGSLGTVIEHKHLGKMEKCTIESGGYFFNTEAHPIDVAALSCCHRKRSNSDYYYDNDEADYENFKANLDLFDLVRMRKVSDLPNFESLLNDQTAIANASAVGENENVFASSTAHSVETSKKNSDVVLDNQESNEHYKTDKEQSQYCSNEFECDQKQSILSTNKIEPSFTSIPTSTSDIIIKTEHSVEITSTNAIHSREEADHVNMSPSSPYEPTKEPAINEETKQPDPLQIDRFDSLLSVNLLTNLFRSFSNVTREFQTYVSELNYMTQNILSSHGSNRQKEQEEQKNEEEEQQQQKTKTMEEEEEMVMEKEEENDSNKEQSFSDMIWSSPPTPNYELLKCPSQRFLSRLSLYGQMFE